MPDGPLLERIDRSLERIDRHIERGNEVIERNTAAFERIQAEFELNREIQSELLRRFAESHREVMKRLEDLGIHMREQTQALIRIQARLAD